MTDDKPSLMFHHTEREAQVARDVEIVWEPYGARNNKLDASDRIALAARTQALPASYANMALINVWRVMTNRAAKQLADQIAVNAVKPYADYVMP